jgi:maleylacetate reductase
MLPSVLRYNRPVNAHKQALVSAAMGHPGEAAADVLDAFIRGLGMPRSLVEVGVGRDQFEVIARNAMHDRHVHTNPVPIKGPEQIIEILEMTA